MRLKLALLLMLFALPTWAAGKPAELDDYVQASAPYGSAKLKVFFMDVYTVQLWQDAASWSYDAPFALSIVYDMDFTRKQLVDESIKQVRRIHKPGDDVLADLRQNLNRLFPDVNEGDRITAIYVPKKEVVLFHNGQKTGSMSDARLLKPFMDIWMSEKTEYPAVRKRMLGI